MTIFCLNLTEDELQALLNLVKTSSVSGTPGMRLLVGLEDKLREAAAYPILASPAGGGSPPPPVPVDPAS